MHTLVIVGSNHKSALELIFARELIHFGYLVDIYPSQSNFLKFYNRSVFHKFLFRLGMTSIISGIQEDFRGFMLNKKPTVVIIFKGMEIRYETISWLKSIGIKVYNYNPDHPYIFSGRGSGNINVKKCIALFDIYFSYASDAIDMLRANGIVSQRIPFGFDNYGFQFKLLKKEEEISKLCFIGNGDKHRTVFLNELSRMGLAIDVFGENWSDFGLSKRIHVSSSLYGEDFWTTMQKYKVQLNLLRPHNHNTHNMRSFDIPGAGGIMLAPKTPDHNEFFVDGVEVFLFSNIKDAFKLAKSIIDLPFLERQKIRLCAREKCVNNYTYKHRVKMMIDLIGEN